MAKIAVLLGSEFEDSEFIVPVKALVGAEHRVEVVGVTAPEMLIGRLRNIRVEATASVTDRRPEDYDALLIPGGYSPDHLRIHQSVVDFVRAFAMLCRPIAAICHGPQLLIEAGLVKGRTMTGSHAIFTDLRNAGANVVDAPVVVDGSLITSRDPEDLRPFISALLSRLKPESAAALPPDLDPSPADARY